MAWTIGGEDFDFREKITTDKDKVPANQTDFRFWLDLSELSANFFTEVDSAGGDIRITQSDGSTQQAVEVVAITTGSSTGLVFFKASSLSSSVDTVFYIYYGNATAVQPAVDSAYGRDNVYTSDDILAWSLQEQGDGTNDEHPDSTGNGNNARDAGTSPTLTAGGLYGTSYQDFDGSGDYIASTSMSISQTQQFVIELLSWADDNQPSFGLLIKGGVEPGASFSLLSGDSGSTDTPGYARCWDADPTFHGTAGLGDIAIGGWSYITYTLDWVDPDMELKLYIDGALTDTTTWSTGELNMQALADRIGLGANDNGGFKFDGRLAFPKIKEGVSWAANDVTAWHNAASSPSTFYSVGDVQEPGVSKIIYY